METAMNGDTVPQFNDLSSLKQRRDEIKSQIDELQQSLKIVNNSLKDMFEETAQMQLAQQGKDFGQTTINTGDHKVTIDFRKRVDWDQDKLIEALNQMDPDTARHYATIKYSIGETKYNNAPPEIQSALSEARTVFLQGVTVNIEDRDTN